MLLHGVDSDASLKLSATSNAPTHILCTIESAALPRSRCAAMRSGTLHAWVPPASPFRTHGSLGRLGCPHMPDAFRQNPVLILQARP